MHHQDTVSCDMKLGVLMELYCSGGVSMMFGTIQGYLIMYNVLARKGWQWRSSSPQFLPTVSRRRAVHDREVQRMVLPMPFIFPCDALMDPTGETENSRHRSDENPPIDRGTLQEVQRRPQTTDARSLISEGNHDTIGMIIVDQRGDLACGTTTNGAANKIAGRVGDSPVAGAGCYVNNDVGGAAATGDGDVMMR